MATVAQATSYTFNFSPDHDYPAGALSIGDTLAQVTSVYEPLYGIKIQEPNNGWNISQLGGCCGGANWLNVGYAPEGRLHWFVNAAPGSYFPAGTTISVDWNGSDGGPATLKAYGGTISTDKTIATIANANDGTAFGGIVGSTSIGPGLGGGTLTLVLPADAKSFTVHQSMLNSSTFVTGFLDGENLAPNAAVNGLRLSVVPEPATAASLAGLAVMLPLAGRRRRA
ncbi:MAG: hypothetical protein AB7G28_06590 [Pirellulales bacterium]